MDKEVIFKSTIAILGAVSSFLFGGFPILLRIFVFIVTIDYVTGLIAAGYKGTLSARVGYWGIARKVLIFLIVALAHQVDLVLGNNNGLVFNATLFFYLSNESISIIENAGKTGIPIPEVIVNAVNALSKKAQENSFPDDKKE